MDLWIILIILAVMLLLAMTRMDDELENFNDEAIANIAKLYNEDDMTVTNMTATGSLKSRGPSEISGLATFKGATAFKGGTGGRGGTHFPWTDNKNYIRGHTQLDGNLNVSGALGGPTVNSVNSQLSNLNRTTAKNNLPCTTRYTGWNSRGNGNTEYLDRHTAYCASNEFMNGFKFERNGNSIRWRFKCCRFK